MAPARKLQREQEDLLERAERLRVRDLHWVMSSAEGRRFVAWLIALTRADEDNFTGSSATYYLQGAEAIGKLLLRKLKSKEHRNEYLLLLEEQDEEKSNA